MTDEQLHRLYCREWHYSDEYHYEYKDMFTIETCLTAMEVVAGDCELVPKLAKILTFLVEAEETEQALKERLGKAATYNVINAFLDEKKLNWKNAPCLDKAAEKKLEEAIDAEAKKRKCNVSEWLRSLMWD